MIGRHLVEEAVNQLGAKRLGDEGASPREVSRPYQVMA